MRTADEERAQVVKYLRETADLLQRLVDQGDKPLLHKHHADSCTYAANAIDAGEHWHVNP